MFRTPSSLPKDIQTSTRNNVEGRIKVIEETENKVTITDGEDNGEKPVETEPEIICWFRFSKGDHSRVSCEHLRQEQPYGQNVFLTKNDPICMKCLDLPEDEDTHRCDHDDICGTCPQAHHSSIRCETLAIQYEPSHDGINKGL